MRYHASCFVPVLIVSVAFSWWHRLRVHGDYVCWRVMRSELILAAFLAVALLCALHALAYHEESLHTAPLRMRSPYGNIFCSRCACLHSRCSGATRRQGPRPWAAIETPIQSLMAMLMHTGLPGSVLQRCSDSCPCSGFRGCSSTTPPASFATKLAATG